MNFIFHELKGQKIAELPEGTMPVRGVDDAIDILGNADYQGARSIVVRKEQLHPDFFKLATGFAGDILQKFSNYRKSIILFTD